MVNPLPSVPTPSWQPPEPQQLQAALNYFCQNRPKKITITIVLKVVGSSRSKENAVVEAQAVATNMTYALLKLLRENPTEPVPSRAIGFVYRMLQAKALGNKGRQTHILSSDLSHNFKNVLSTKQYSLPGTLRLGVFRSVALMILLWCRKISGNQNDSTNLDTDIQEEGIEDIEGAGRDLIADVSELETIYRIWLQRYAVYKHAKTKQQVPFGRNRGKSLGKVGHRDLRWVLERLPPTKVVQTTLAHVQALLNPDPNNYAATLRAKRANHPWRRNSRRYRAVRLRYFDQRTPEPRGPLIKLGRMATSDLERLRDELLEQLQFAPQIAKLRVAIKVLLYRKPSNFPSVDKVPITSEQYAHYQRQYELALATFPNPFPAKGKPGREIGVSAQRLEYIERGRAARLHKTAWALLRHRLQPLHFTRTIYPGHYEPAFAVLYDKHTKEYVLAIVIHGKHAAKHFKPNCSENLYYVNFPETRFAPPQVSCLLFSLKYGKEYHDANILRQVIEQQRVAQHQQHENQDPMDLRLELDECLPKATIGSATLLSRRNRIGQIELYVHIPIKVQVKSCRTVPQHVLGIHEHDEGYSYALLTWTGDVLECGELVIPKHVRKLKHGRIYSENYAFEVAHAMVKLAVEKDAYLGVEDAGWKRRASTSRRQNEQRFGRPRKKIAEIAKYKALQAGLPAPHLAYGVSPSRMCSYCGPKNPKRLHKLLRRPKLRSSSQRSLKLNNMDRKHRPKLRWYGKRHRSRLKGSSRVHYRPTVVCYDPMCASRSFVQKSGGSRKLRCTECSKIWNEKEFQFWCITCHTRRLARFNTAIVVAQQTMIQVIKHYTNILKRKKQEQKNDRKSMLA